MSNIPVKRKIVEFKVSEDALIPVGKSLSITFLVSLFFIFFLLLRTK